MGILNRTASPSSSFRARSGLLALALLAASSGASGCKKDGPKEEAYYVLTFPVGVPVGGDVMLGEKKLGTIEGPTTMFDRDEVAGKPLERVPTNVPLAIVRFDAETWLSESASSLAVALGSPCGTTKVPLALTGFTRDEEEHLREQMALRAPRAKQIVVSATVQAPSTRSTQVWVDRGDRPTAIVTIGQRALELGTMATGVVGLDCQARHEVKAEGKTIGTLVIDPAKGPPKGLVISLVEGQCYALNAVHYMYADMAGGGTTTTTTFKAPFGMLDTDEIDYFLREAPGTQRRVAHLTELVPTACTGKGAEPAKGKKR